MQNLDTPHGLPHLTRAYHCSSLKAGSTCILVQEDKGEPSEEDAFVATAKRISSLKQAGLTSTGDGRQPSAARDQPDPAKLGDDMKAFLTELPAHATAKPTLRSLSDTRKAAPKKRGDVRVSRPTGGVGLGG